MKNIRGKESTVSMFSVLGLELHYPTMITMWEHGDRSKIKKIRNFDGFSMSKTMATETVGETRLWQCFFSWAIVMGKINS